MVVTVPMVVRAIVKGTVWVAVEMVVMVLVKVVVAEVRILTN